MWPPISHQIKLEIPKGSKGGISHLKVRSKELEKHGTYVLGALKEGNVVHRFRG